MLKRLFRLIIKELLVTAGDKKARLMLVVPVLLQIVVFPWAATLEVKNSSIVIYNQDNGPSSIEILQRLTRTSAFGKILAVHSDGAMQDSIDNQQALIALRMPADLSRNLQAGRPATVQVLIDGRRSNSGQIAAGYVSQILQATRSEHGVRPTSTVNIRNLFNPNLDFKWHIVPSLVAIITTIGCLTVTALSVAREREEGTFDQLLVSPLTPGYIMAGKAVPGVLVALGQAGLIVLVAVFGYGLPYTGSLITLLVAIVFFGLALAGIGLFISSISANQQQAFLGVFSFMAPAVLLSGYVSPIENMPLIFQWIARMNPLSYLVPLSKGLFLKGFGFGDAWPFLWPMLVIATCTLSVSLALFRRHIA